MASVSALLEKTSCKSSAGERNRLIENRALFPTNQVLFTMSTAKDDKELKSVPHHPDLGLLEEDDEFEEFPAEGT